MAQELCGSRLLRRCPLWTRTNRWSGQDRVSTSFTSYIPSIVTHDSIIDEYTTVNATIPQSTPSGDYLLRVEHIALHLAMQANKAQFYLSCSQITITGGGKGTPGPLTTLPGAYKSTDPGIFVNLGAIKPEAYQPPGPAVWSG